MGLPTTDTSMFRFHILFVPPSKVFNSQVNNPSSAEVTLKIIRVACWATQLTLNLEVKDALVAASPVDGIMLPTEVPSSLMVTKIRLSSLVRLNSQFKWTLVDPLRSFVLFVWTNEGSVTVSNGGGSNQVTLPTASEVVIIKDFYRNKILPQHSCQLMFFFRLWWRWIFLILTFNEMIEIMNWGSEI